MAALFEFLFRYPRSVFSKGDIVFMGSWPLWLMGVLIVAAAVALAVMIRSRLPETAANIRNWRVWVIWGLQAALAALLIVLLWQPAIMISELKPQQNIVAVLVDDSRSMAINEDGSTRRDKEVKALKSGVLDELNKKFQTRLYRLDGHLARIQGIDEVKADAPSTRIGESLKQLANESAGLPVGAILLLSDGGDNSGGVGLDTISALRNRRIPVHTVGFGREKIPHDIEINDVHMAPRAMADSRLVATVTFHQNGYGGRKAKLAVRDGGKVLAVREVTLASDGNQQTETMLFSAGTAGAKTLNFALDVMDGEENRDNNAVNRLVNVDAGKRRILYIEGEPRWEFKFIRRAKESDRSTVLVTMLRTTENKVYRQTEPQNMLEPKENAEGFPARVDEMFRYDAVIIGSVQADYFTPTQQDLIKQFVDRRGGGMLLLGGRFALSDGGWPSSSLSEMLPVVLPPNKGTFHRDEVKVEPTAAGLDSIICRLVEDPARNAERWKKMPEVMNYQEIGTVKPGAVSLLEATPGNRRLPFLVTQHYGRGRTAVLASEGTWRWQMLQPVEDQTHEVFWQQLMRWLVSDTPGRVVVSTANQMLFDDGTIKLSAEVRDKNYLPAADASVEAHIMGPEGLAASIPMTPDPVTPGIYVADYNAEKPGSYMTEVTAKRGDEDTGRDVLTFQRSDGVAENFHVEQNRDLLEKLATNTGGRYWRPDDLSKLGSEIAYSEAGITIRQTKDLWNLPFVFLLVVLLRFSEWLLRRKWGIV